MENSIMSHIASSPWVFAPALAALLVFVAALVDLRRKTVKPSLSYQRTKFNEGVMSRMPTLKEVYRPMLGLTNGHVETIFAAKFRQRCELDYRRECIYMPDGGLVALDWRCTPAGETELDHDAAVLILLPGLTGGGDDSYVRFAVKYAHSIGVRAVVFNSRGSGDTFLTTPQFYSGVFVEDLKHVIAHISRLHPNSQLFATGWSLGANILVNYLGFVGEATPLAAASALCNPFDLTMCDTNLKKGFNQVYDRNLAHSMSRMMRRNVKVWNGERGQIDAARNAATIRDWDDAITRVTFGFPSVDAYYAAAGSYQRVAGVRIPLLVVQAYDDPIAIIGATPREALLANPHCILAVTPTGGHLGWCSGEGGYTGEPWTDRIIVEWLQACQLQLAAQGVPPKTAARARTGATNGARAPQLLSPAATPQITLPAAGTSVFERSGDASTNNGSGAPLPASPDTSPLLPSASGLRADTPLKFVVPLQPLQPDQYHGGYPRAKQPGPSGHDDSEAMDSTGHENSNGAPDGGAMDAGRVELVQKILQVAAVAQVGPALAEALAAALRAEGAANAVDRRAGLLTTSDDVPEPAQASRVFQLSPLPPPPAVAVGGDQGPGGESTPAAVSSSESEEDEGGADALEVHNLEREMEAMYRRASPARSVDVRSMHGSVSSPSVRRSGLGRGFMGQDGRSPGSLWWGES